jgi:hypothetical protein
MTLLNPHEIEGLSFSSCPKDNVDIFDIEDTKEGQKIFRQIIDSHLGVDYNILDIVKKDEETGELDEDSFAFWNETYGGRKKIAFYFNKIVGLYVEKLNQWYDLEGNLFDNIPNCPL